jgi:hypothetical protein
VARTIGDADESWLVWRWLTSPGTTIDESGVAIPMSVRSVPRLERIAV